jgi:hypothetical protein
MSIGKIMAIVFGDLERILLMDYMPHSTTITGDAYAAVLQNLGD